MERIKRISTKVFVVSGHLIPKHKGSRVRGEVNTLTPPHLNPLPGGERKKGNLLNPLNPSGKAFRTSPLTAWRKNGISNC